MRKTILFICIVFFVVRTSWGQNEPIDSLRADFDKLYGLDVLLTNGKKYFPDSNPVIGHPFWRSKDSFSADLTISGRTFKGQSIKYNLNKQEFLLLYTNYNGQQGQIILNTSAIDSVNTGMYRFVPSVFPEIKQQFVQLIHQGHLSCYIGWYKELKFNTLGPYAGYEYTKDFRTYYVLYNGRVYHFTNKSSFLRIFNQKERASIRKYISSNRFRFRKMNEYNLRKLIVYCDKTVI
ncbi:MAG TPA: hypothetical protein VGK38_04400 [Prolixibacteraceae bacterium]|jgi:hypothetical protein